MNMGELFKEYWRAQGRYSNDISNPARFGVSLQNKMDNCTTFDEIDEYVLSLRTRRESTRLIMVDFFNYLKKKKNVSCDSCLFEKQFYDYPFERQLEIAKYLHKRRTAEDVEYRFDIEERTRRADLNALENGIKVLGSEIKIEKTRENGEDYYKSTMHPIFLPLNLTEVYALTAYLDQLMDDNDPNADIIRSISERIKSQLSEYALDKLFGESEESKNANNYLPDEELAHKKKGILMYLMKSGQPCEFEYDGKNYCGKFSFRGGKYTIKLEDGSVLDADISKVIFNIDSLDYK